MIELLQQYESIDLAQWEALYHSSPYATPFQSAACYRFLESLSFLKPFVYGVQEDGVLRGVVVGYIQQEASPLLGYFSRRAIVNGGGVMSVVICDEALTVMLTGCYGGLRSQVIYVELRNFHDYSNYKPLFVSCGFEYHAHLNFKVTTSSIAEVDGGMSKGRRRNIKSALECGAIVTSDFNDDELHSFYAILAQIYRERVKRPLFPYEFFKQLSESEFGEVLLVKYEGAVVGGIACAVEQKQAIYEWFVCGLDDALRHVSPSILSTYAGMVYAVEHKIPYFDMMGAGSPDEIGRAHV